jgi:uncharacterized damage-inducible protein DinB
MHDALRLILLRDLDAAIREVELYASDDALWQTQDGITNSGGALARHIAANLRHFIGHVLGKSDYARNRHAEFAPSDLTRKQVAAELRAASREVDAALKALVASGDAGAARVAAPYPTPVANKQLSTQQFLIHLTSHLGYHLGQLDYHRRMNDPKATTADTMSFATLPTV